MPRDVRKVVTHALAVIALGGLVSLGPFFFASGLMAPGWAVAVFIGVWLALVLAGCLWIRRRPVRVIPLPFIAAGIWFGGMSAGGAWLGWTA